MFRLVLCVLLGLATFKLALAEPQNPTVPITRLPIMIQCTASEIVDRMVEDYEEIPFFESQGSWEIPNGQTLSGRVVMYLSRSTKTYTLVIEFEEDIKCVVISGRDLQPWYPNKTVL